VTNLISKNINHNKIDLIMGKILVGKTSDVAQNTMKKISVEGKEILIVNIGEFYAVDDTCTHAGASLSEGKLNDSTIVCGWHGAQFSCKDGCLVKFPTTINGLKSYKVVVEEDDIFVEV